MNGFWTIANKVLRLIRIDPMNLTLMWEYQCQTTTQLLRSSRRLFIILFSTSLQKHVILRA